MDERPGATRRLKAGLKAGRGLVTTVTNRRRRDATPGSAPRSAPSSPLRPGIARSAPFAGYTILRQLGAGGMAEVYLALHPRLPRRDVIKVLAEAITADAEFRERFNREADLAATLWHPHIVGVHDRGEFQGQLWISMDYVEGTDASRLVKEAHPQGMPVDDVCGILDAVAGALDYAHDRGLLHRDVKPANILLTHPEDPVRQERRILLADFGVARHLADISGITQTNVAVGTVAYAAPEQLAGSNIDRRADQYALAATAFHLLTGAPPFRHTNPVAVISQHLHDDPPRLSDHRPDLAHLDDVFAKALAKKPEDRFERCRLFAAAVRAGSHEAREPEPPEAPGDRAAVSRKPPTRVRMAAALVCAVLIAVAATWSTLYSFQTDPSPPNPALAARPAAPAPPAAAPAVVAPTPSKVLDGTYRLDLNRAKRTTNGTPIRHDGGTTNWWAFHSVCTAAGCAATGVRLDDATHQVADTTDGGQNDTLRFVAGYWQGAPQQIRIGCRQANQQVGATQQETVALSLALQADGTLRGVQTETVGSNECGAQGAVLRVPVVATRVGDVPPNLALSDPAQTIVAATAPATRPMPPVLGGVCSDVDKLGYDQTSNEQVVCEGNTWDKAPITTGVHAAGSTCDRPDIPVFAMSASNDGYLIECDPVTRMWTRHR